MVGDSRPVADGAPGDEALRIVTHAALRSADILGVSNDELATILHLPIPGIERAVSGQAMFRGEAHDSALMFVRAADSLAALAGANNDGAAQSWLRSTNTILHGAPIDLMQTAEGLKNVVHYLEAKRYRI